MRENKKLIEEKRKNSQLAELLQVDEMSLLLAEMADAEDDEFFVPTRPARHKPPDNVKSIQGKIFQTKSIPSRLPVRSKKSSPSQKQVHDEKDAENVSGNQSEDNISAEDSEQEEHGGNVPDEPLVISEEEEDRAPLQQRPQRKRKERRDPAFTYSPPMRKKRKMAGAVKEGRSIYEKTKAKVLISQVKNIQAQLRNSSPQRQRQSNNNSNSRTPEPMPRDGPDPNPTKVVFIKQDRGKERKGRITRCQGCPEPLNPDARPPRNLVFQRKAYRSYPLGSSWVYKRNLENVYFHPTLRCLHNFNRRIREEEITCPPDVMKRLTVGHMNLLSREGILEHITANYEDEEEEEEEDEEY